MGGDGPGRLLRGGEISCSILPPLQLCQTCPIVEMAILVAWAVPLGVGEVARGLADGADERPEHRACHQARGILQLMASVLGLSLSIGIAELAHIHFFHHFVR